MLHLVRHGRTTWNAQHRLVGRTDVELDEVGERQARALRSPQPVRALWEMLTDPAGAMLTQEFSALANHRKDIRAEYAALADRFRQQQEDMLKPVLADYGIDLQQFPADALLLIPPAIASGLGELGKHGSMISRRFGSGMRLAGVTTNMPTQSWLMRTCCGPASMP